MDRFELDSIVFPVNFVLYQEGKFGPQILAHAKKKLDFGERFRPLEAKEREDLRAKALGIRTLFRA